MIQCGVTHKWIIHSHWLSPRLRKNDYMSWFSPAFPQSPGQMRTVLSSRPPDSHDNGHCSRVWYSDWVGWSEATLHKQKEQPVPKQTIAWHRGKEGRFCSGPFLTPSCLLLSSPPCLVLGVRSGVHLSVAYPLPSEGPWDLGKFLCALHSSSTSLTVDDRVDTWRRLMAPTTESWAERKLKRVHYSYDVFFPLWTVFSLLYKEKPFREAHPMLKAVSSEKHYYQLYVWEYEDFVMETAHKKL